MIASTDGGSASDSIAVPDSFKSLVINITQSMGNDGSQVKVDNSDEITVDEVYDVRMIEITIHSRTPKPIDAIPIPCVAIHTTHLTSFR